MVRTSSFPSSVDRSNFIDFSCAPHHFLIDRIVSYCRIGRGHSIYVALLGVCIIVSMLLLAGWVAVSETDIVPIVTNYLPHKIRSLNLHASAVPPIPDEHTQAEFAELRHELRRLQHTYERISAETAQATAAAAAAAAETVPPADCENAKTASIAMDDDADDEGDRLMDHIDDLHDVHLSTFPAFPLTMRTALLCDNNTQVVMQGGHQLRCPKDPSCTRCYRPTIAIAEALKQQYKGDRTFAQRRAMRYEKLDKDRPVILMAVNLGQVPLLLNWQCSLRANGIDEAAMLSNTVIFASDEGAHELITQHGMPSIRPPAFEGPFGWKGKSGQVSKGISGHYDPNKSASAARHSLINLIITYAANELVQKGFAVLLHDVDLVWLKDPFPALHHLAAHRDIVGQAASRNSFATMKPTTGLCTGFILIRPTHHSKVFMQTLENVSPLKETSDQAMFNTLLRHWKFRQLHWRSLPSRFFPEVGKRCWGKSKHGGREMAFINHRVGTLKVQRFVECGVWYLRAGLNHSSIWVNRDVNVALLAGDVCRK